MSRGDLLALIGFAAAVAGAAPARAQLCGTDRVLTILESRRIIACRADPSISGCDELDVDGDGDVDLCDAEIAICARNVPLNTTTCCADADCRACTYVSSAGDVVCEESSEGQCTGIGGETGPETCPTPDAGTSDGGVVDAGALDAAVPDGDGGRSDARVVDDGSLPTEGGASRRDLAFRGGGGCACRAAGEPSPRGALWMVLWFVAVLGGRRAARTLP